MRDAVQLCAVENGDWPKMAQHLAKVVKKAPKIGAAIGKVVDKNGHYKAVKVKVEEVKFNDFLNMVRIL